MPRLDRNQNDLNKLLQEHLNELLSFMSPTLFITVDLYAHKQGCSEKVIEQLCMKSYEEFKKHFFNIIDRRIYGPRHKGISSKDKFAYAFRIESTSRRGKTICPHIHCLLELTKEEKAKYKSNAVSIHNSVYSFFKIYDFQGAFHEQDHNGKNCDYITKFIHADADNFYERNLVLRKEQYDRNPPASFNTNKEWLKNRGNGKSI